MSVYVIYNQTNKTVKIGYSKDPDKRLKELQTGNSDRLEVVYRCDGELSLEQSIHNSLSSYKLQGEWYQYEEVKDLLCELLPGWQVPDLKCLQFYPQLSVAVARLDRILSVKLLMWILNVMDENNSVHLNEKRFAEFSKWLEDQGSKPFHPRTVYQGLKELMTHNILLKWGNSSYQLNPLFIWSDNTQKRINSINQLAKHNLLSNDEN